MATIRLCNHPRSSFLTGVASVQVVLFDVQQRNTIAELSTPFIKYCVWSNDMGHVALLSKHAIIIANKRLGSSCTGANPLHLLSLGAQYGTE